MKITKVETFYVKPHWLFIKLSTDTDVVGWGEAMAQSRVRTVISAVEDLQPLLLGQDPGLIELLWQRMSRAACGRGDATQLSAMSGVEQALWDIKGKALGVPVYTLLGGPCRKRVRLCARCGGTTPQDAAFQAKGWRVKGYTALKLTLEAGAGRQLETPDLTEKIVARFAAVQQEVGRSVDVAMDFRALLSPTMAQRVMAALAPHDPLFIEEPAPPENIGLLAKLAAATRIPVGTGGRYASRWALRDALESGSAMVAQPGIGQAGGIAEMRHIAALAELYGATLAPHNTLGPIAFAAALQVAACTPNFLVLEHLGLTNKWDLGQGYLAAPFVVREGFVDLPTSPGLGIDVQEGMLHERSHDPSAELARTDPADDFNG